MLEALALVHSLREAMLDVPDRKSELKHRIEVACTILLDSIVAGIECSYGEKRNCGVGERARVVAEIVSSALEDPNVGPVVKDALKKRDVLLERTHNAE